ncbi:MAG TPA: serine hydrolase domain-containing protein [Stellaceae bacterium]|nr:serine hydrolase domain-containing protein [Stellaceae bacterium]
MPNTPSLPLAQPAEVGLSAPRLQRHADALRRDVDRGRLPGAVALVARRGRIAWFESIGQRDPVKGRAMERDAIFRIYSMTKPIASVAAMTLYEEGRFQLADSIARYIPAFAKPKLATPKPDGTLEIVPAGREITIQDLLRHTSGLTYEFRGTAPVQRLYMNAKTARRNQTNEEHAATIAGLPLMYVPGTAWEYSRSTDIIGRLVEVISGQSLASFIAERITGPLAMHDTAFHVPPEKQHRLAEAFPNDPDTGTGVELLEVREPPKFESGGGGMVSTALDYARFLAMLAHGGTLDGERILGRKTIEFMTADHLGPITGTPDLLIPGYGFGLGFAVRLHAGIAQIAGSVGQYYWGGLAGTTFWVDPAEELFAIMMIQAPGQREYYRVLFRDMVYASLND